LEVNPRGSRTVPFVAKATGVPVANIAAKVMTGEKLKSLGITEDLTPHDYSVKESVFPFRKFAGVDIVLGPEMRSTGEVMGVSDQFPVAFAKSQLASGVEIPDGGTVFISVRGVHKERVVDVATPGTAQRLQESGIEAEPIKKLRDGSPNLIDRMKDDAVDLVLNTPNGKGARTDEGIIRAAAVQQGVPCITTIQAVEVLVDALVVMRKESMDVESLQDRYAKA
jgi:carbamoyl-phosphate synthase large subunit